jgi:hypothetical protein
MAMSLWLLEMGVQMANYQEIARSTVVEFLTTRQQCGGI